MIGVAEFASSKIKHNAEMSVMTLLLPFFSGEGALGNGLVVELPVVINDVLIRGLRLKCFGKGVNYHRVRKKIEKIGGVQVKIQ